MARDPGEWYDEKRQEAEHADWAIRHLQAYLQEYLSALVRTLEAARYVGD